MTEAPSLPNYRYVSRKRRTKEDRRFITGRGNFVADVDIPGMKHVAVLPSPHPRANIISIDISAAIDLPGVHFVLTGDELAAETNSLFHGLDLPNVRWHPLAVGMTRYAGEWVAAIVADSRYIAEDAAELIEVKYEALSAAVDSEKMIDEDQPLVHPDHGSNVLFRKTWEWGPVAEDFADMPHTVSYRARWGRSSTVPIETFGVVAKWDEIGEIMDVWASIQMPQYQDQIAAALRLPMNNVRVHNDVDVGGSYGVKRGIKHTVLVSYLAKRLGSPIRFIEDRLDNMSGGDAHGPDRIFDITMAFDDEGVIKSMKIKALDDVGAYPGRAPLQLGKPMTALCGPYRVNSIEYEAISVTSNKTGQVPVRGFGQSPTNFAIETGLERVAKFLGLDRVEVRTRNLVRKDEFPWKIPPGSIYDSGDFHAVLESAIKTSDWEKLIARRDALRSEGKLAGVGITTCLEPGGGNNIFEYLFNPKLEITTFVESILIKVEPTGAVTAVMCTTTSGQGHETMVSTIAGEELERDPDTIRVVHGDSLEALPTRSPVASRMTIVLGTATSNAAREIKDKMITIAAYDLGVDKDQIEYADGEFNVRGEPQRKLLWGEICQIAHKQFHRMPPGHELGLQAYSVQQVPGAGHLPNEKNEVPLYPCFSFQAHVPLVEVDPDTGKVKVHDYFIAHDCGTAINPDIVRGMIIGGVAHGVGAALYEKFEYDPDGQLLAGTFVDYLLPSAHEIPPVTDIEHCTPSPMTSLGQKGSGEGGYLGAPAAIASAVNDALSPFDIEINELPIRARDIEAALHEKSNKRNL
ncbi:MAG: Caffeine dehydrogenase subunit alpha [Alphaproteobacteria bacterium MarineAlpha11_Bin1]|nr:MAG: Caffeine dehydrogenase subunit alpha [Alphaproteobacteria bacterium MarineAlpha11_Bin1]|tara:strand:- start:3712 stop:6123 length:2412 start_codon:yes stop_codon:yes gene_type:complete